MQFIQEQFFFFIAIFLVLFLPGLVLLRTFFKNTFTSLELFVFSVPVSIALTNFIMIILGRSGFKLTVFSIISSLVTFCVIITILSWVRRKISKACWSTIETTPVSRSDGKSLENFSSTTFTKRQGWIIISILVLTIFIKTVYLSQVILPTATDLGHHMYWSKTIAVTSDLPQYVERNIVETNGVYVLGTPEPIDDFIIGEHLIFAAIALIAGLDFISGFPAITLLLINIFALLAVFVFTLKIFSSKQFSQQNISAQTIAIITLFVLGPLYALASPQAKFVSGGVIGNTMGNLFIPVVLYCYWRALQEKSSQFLTLAFFLTFGLAYIHHLSTLVFLFIMFFTIITFSVFNSILPTFSRRGIKGVVNFSYFTEWFKLFFRPAPLIFALAAILFFFFVLAPSYADPKSLHTALGTATKATRTGLTFLQFTFSTGEGRLGLGLVGLLTLLLFQFSKKTPPHEKNSCHPELVSGSLTKTQILKQVQDDNYGIAFLFAWGFSLLIMSLRPQWLFLDIPSNRIGSYAIFPFAILSAFAFTQLFQTKKQTTPTTMTASAFLVILTFFIVGGFYDNGQSLLDKTKAQEAIETYRVSDYLAQHNQSNDLILKDHNYIVADSWMKLSFLQGYTYPLSRGYFKRYEDETKPREQCTLWMIAVPNTDKGKQCFDDTGTNIIIVNPHFDSAQFKKSDEFSSVYQSNDIAVYIRK